MISTALLNDVEDALEQILLNYTIDNTFISMRRQHLHVNIEDNMKNLTDYIKWNKLGIQNTSENSAL